MASDKDAFVSAALVAYSLWADSLTLSVCVSACGGLLSRHANFMSESNAEFGGDLEGHLGVREKAKGACVSQVKMFALDWAYSFLLAQFF